MFNEWSISQVASGARRRDSAKLVPLPRLRNELGEERERKSIDRLQRHRGEPAFHPGVFSA